MRRNGLEVIPGNVLFPGQGSNPYVAEFEEEVSEPEDIIRIGIAAPQEAYYYDENGTEKIELKEQSSEDAIPPREENSVEIFTSEVLSAQDILKEASSFGGQKEDGPHT